MATGSKNHILILASYAPSLINFRGPLLKELLKNGYIVSVSAPNISDSLQQKLEDLGINVYETPLHRKGIGVVSDLRYHQSVFHLMDSHKPDLVLTYTIKPNIWGAFAAWRANIPSFSLITGLGYAFSGAKDSSNIKDRLVGLVARLLYRAAVTINKKVIFQNPDDRDEFLSMGTLQDSSKASIINGSGVDLTHFYRVPISAEPIFLMIARLLTSKGVYEFVEAAQKLKTRFPNVRCVLVGPNDAGPEAIDPNILQKWQSEEIIEYAGSVEDVRPLIAQSSVYVLPSYREGTPRSVLEAMSMGRPIITTDTPGCRETVKDGINGFLIPVRDSLALANAMQRFVEDPLLIASMGQKSYEMACEKYDVNKVNAEILEIIKL